MALAAQLYGLDPDETSKLSQVEVDYLIDEAHLAFIQMAGTADLQQVLQPRLRGTLRAFRAARDAGGAGDPDQ